MASGGTVKENLRLTWDCDWAIVSTPCSHSRRALIQSAFTSGKSSASGASLFTSGLGSAASQLITKPSAFKPASLSPSKVLAIQKPKSIRLPNRGERTASLTQPSKRLCPAPLDWHVKHQWLPATQFERLLCPRQPWTSQDQPEGRGLKSANHGLRIWCPLLSEQLEA